MRKIVTLCSILILALGGFGAAYASWTDEVTITETVSTGEFCMTLGSVTLLDGPLTPETTGYVVGVDGPGHDYSVSQIGIGFPSYSFALDKNVGWASYVVSDPVPGTQFMQTVTFTLNNVYPCYYNHIDVWVNNCGTVPLKIQDIILKDKFGAVVEVFNVNNQLTYRAFDFGGEAGVSDFEIQWGNNWGAQIEPLGNPVNMSMGMHVLQDHFAEDETWSFSLTIVGVQWNEYPY